MSAEKPLKIWSLDEMLEGPARFYHEAHLTLEPSEEVSYEQFAESMAEFGWKVSKFEHDDVDGIQGKWFLSFRCEERADMIRDLKGMIYSLGQAGETVTRWKIEQTVADSKLEHVLDRVS